MTAEVGRPTRVVADGFELNGVDEFGVVWRFLSIDGWHEAVDTDVPQTQHVVSHGQFQQDGHRKGRAFQVNGQILTEDRALMPDALDRLNAILADGGLGLFEFYDRTQGRRWAKAQLLSKPEVAWAQGGPVAMYRLPLLSPSPYKYGVTSTASTGLYALPPGVGLVFPLFPDPSTLDFNTEGVVTGIVTISNGGKADASVKLLVTGPTPAEGFTIIDLNTGRRITWAGAVVPEGSYLEFDGNDGTVTIDGVADRSGDAIIEHWPTVPAGGSLSLLFSSLGTSDAVLTASCVSTYW